MKTFNTIIIVIICFSCLSCRTDKNLIVGTWECVKISPTDPGFNAKYSNKEVLVESADQDNRDKPKMDFSSSFPEIQETIKNIKTTLKFESNSNASFMTEKGATQGSWVFNNLNQTINFKFNDSKTVFPIKIMKTDKMFLTVSENSPLGDFLVTYMKK